MTASAIGILCLLLLIILGVPISISLFLTGFVGIWVLVGYLPAEATLSVIPFSIVLQPDMATLPLYILTGELVLVSGVAHEGYEVAHRWLGRLPGGLALATMATSAAFAACSASSTAAAAVIAKLGIPEMKKYGYSDALAGGTCAAGGILAVMIPPAGGLILYGIIAQQSIGRLFMAGILPGIMLAVLFMIGISVLTAVRPSIAPRGPKFSWRERFVSVPRVWGLAAIIIVIIGGIFTGILTASEAAAGGCVIGLILVFTRMGRKGWRLTAQALWGSASTAAMLFFLIIGAFVFTAFISLTGMPTQIAGLVAEAHVARHLILLLILLIYIPFGMFLDTAAMMLITIPIFFPIVVRLGFDPIWYGVFTVMMEELGFLTPPIGICCWIVGGVAPDIPLTSIFKGAFIFMVLDLVGAGLLILFPQIALWLPSLMMR